MMTIHSQPSEKKATDRYTAQLIAALRLRNVPGQRIGEVVAEVEAHVADSGQSAEKAFGPARAYAGSIPAPAVNHRRGLRSIPLTLAIGVGAWATVSGFAAAWRGHTYWGVNGFVLSAIGAAVVLLGLTLTPVDAIVDPRHGRRRYTRGGLVLIAAGFIAAVLIVLAILLTLTA